MSCSKDPLTLSGMLKIHSALNYIPYERKQKAPLPWRKGSFPRDLTEQTPNIIYLPMVTKIK